LDTAVDGTSRGGAGPDAGEAAGRTPGTDGFEWDRARDHCRVAWLRGRFLARGSLTLGVGSTHLEFVVEPDEAPVLAARLATFELPASWRLRRGRGVVTWKSTERILAFLSRLGASSSVLEAESRLVTRQLHGHLNRVLNAETSNLSRSVAASHRQRQAIERLEATGRLGGLPPLERDVAKLRLDQPEASLAELADQLQVSRPRVQRALQRIESAAVHESGGLERPAPA
jgi:DNA-binding protein WhiA